MQEPVRVGGRLAGDAWGLNGHGTMITPCLSMSRDRQPASKRKEPSTWHRSPCTRKRAGTRSRRPRTAGLIDQQQWRDPVTRIGVRQQQRLESVPWLRSTDGGRPGGRSLRSRSRSRAGLRLGERGASPSPAVASHRCASAALLRELRSVAIAMARYAGVAEVKAIVRASPADARRRAIRGGPLSEPHDPHPTQQSCRSTTSSWLWLSEAARGGRDVGPGLVAASRALRSLDAATVASHHCYRYGLVLSG